MKKPSRVAAALALSICAVLVVALSAGPASAKRQAAPKTCETLAIVAWIPNGNGNGTAGSVYYKVDLQNSGSKTCTLKGYPTVSALGLTGGELATAARHEGGAGKTVTLAPGSAASFNLRVTEAGNYSPSQCHPAPAQGVTVRWAGAKAGKFVPLPFEACRSQSLLGVSAIRKG